MLTCDQEPRRSTAASRPFGFGRFPLVCRIGLRPSLSGSSSGAELASRGLGRTRSPDRLWRPAEAHDRVAPALAEILHLFRVSAGLFVGEESGPPDPLRVVRHGP